MGGIPNPGSYEGTPERGAGEDPPEGADRVAGSQLELKSECRFFPEGLRIPSPRRPGSPSGKEGRQYIPRANLSHLTWRAPYSLPLCWPLILDPRANKHHDGFSNV